MAEKQHSTMKAKKKEKLAESGRLILRAGQILGLGSWRGFILSQVINTLPELNLQELQEMGKAVSYFENLVRRKHFHQTMEEELLRSGCDWEAKLIKTTEESEADKPKELAA
jgi:hypothetical protein